MLISVAMRSGEKVFRLVVEITGSNPAPGVDVCSMSLYVLLSQALRRADHFSKKSAMCVSEINVLWRGLDLTVTGVKKENRLSKRSYLLKQGFNCRS
jgi:hypothetical protein